MNNKLVFVLAIGVIILSVIAIFVVFKKDNNEDTITLETNQGDVLQTYIQSLEKKSAVFSKHNKGTIPEFMLPLDRGAHTCTFFVYDDYTNEDLNKEQNTTDIDINDTTRFIIKNQDTQGTTNGTYGDNPALFIVKPEQSFTYYQAHTLYSKSKQDPITIQTNLYDHTGWYVQCTLL